MSRLLSLSLCLAILLGAGCQPDAGEPDPAATAELRVRPRATMIADAPPAGTARAALLPAVAEVWEGQLQARKLDDNSLSTHYWSAGFDPTAYTFESYKTILLRPGTYELKLLLEHDGDQYAGTAVGPITDGTNDVALTLSPIIGDQIVDASLIDRLADFRFDYDAGELSGLSTPRLGVSVDSAPEQLFALDPATGDSAAFLSLSDGPHHLRLNLYDGSLHLARSRPEQEAIVVVPGANHDLDLIPLRGETTLSLGIDGGPATFTIRISEEVAAEAGGLASLHTIFAFAGQQSTVFETAVTFQPAGAGLLSATVHIPEAHHGAATLSLTFYDQDVGPAPGELLGSCTSTTTLGTASATVACHMQLRRRAVISGSLLAALGVNVFTADGAPVPGSVITIGGAPAGITGSGTFGTAGYFQTYLLRGTYVVRAEHAASQTSGEQTITLAPLGVGNVDLFLSSSAPASCGNGELEPAAGEQCDDGNQTSGDGCSSACAIEPSTAFRVAGTHAFVVPAACSQIAVELWGGGGGGGSPPAGGGAGFTAGKVAVAPGETLTVIVGAGGVGRVGSGSGDGGGGTALLRASAPLLVAGGGGGGGSGGTSVGGGGGGAVGGVGPTYTVGGFANSGNGGTQTAAGTAGTGSRRNGFAGAGRNGGHGSNRCGGSGSGGGASGFGIGGRGYPYCIDGSAGGGGGGWFGGGGGGGNAAGGGGGGGSGHIAPSPEVTDASMATGAGRQPGNAADADRQSAGSGGTTGMRGNDGAVVIRCP